MLLIGNFTVKLSHGPLGAVFENGLYGLVKGGNGLLKGFPLVGGEPLQDIVGEILSGLSAVADAETKPDEVFPDVLKEALDPVVPSGAAADGDFESTGGEGDIVIGDNQLGWIDPEESNRFSEGNPA